MKSDRFYFESYSDLKEFVDKKTPRLNSYLTYFDPDKWKWILYNETRQRSENARASS